MSNLGSLLGFYTMIASPILDIPNQNREWRERLRKEYKDTQNLPRKKKKQERKRILSLWRIACWNPLTDKYEFD
jgi:hypothetical protein